METILVIGTHTDAGAHLARQQTHSEPVSPVICTEPCATIDTARAQLIDEGITRAVFCGRAAQSAWLVPTDEYDDTPQLDRWAEACWLQGIPLTFLSSDALFTGPWMFHWEDDRNFCPSAAASKILRQESRLQAIHPAALIVRTHLFGWSPNGWLNRFEGRSSQREPQLLDCVPHATPMYAGLFPALLDEIHASGLTGILHLSGSERISQHRLGCRIAHALGAPAPSCRSSVSLKQRPTGFARGEMSLQTAHARKILGRGLPTIQDSLDAALRDRDNGLAASLSGAPPQVLSHVA